MKYRSAAQYAGCGKLYSLSPSDVERAGVRGNTRHHWAKRHSLTHTSPCPLPSLRGSGEGIFSIVCPLLSRSLISNSLLRLFLWALSLTVGAFSQISPDAKQKKDASATKTAVVAEEAMFKGCCDASAAAPISTNLVVVASDEENVLRVYDRVLGGMPVRSFDLSSHLGLGRGSSETDIEGAALLGDTVYWITSHSRNSDGLFRPNRHRFFATRFKVTGDRVEMEFVGRPYHRLLEDLGNSPRLAQLDLARASRLPPKNEGAVNIEGLCATPDGRLFIGFRNPMPGGRALIIPLENPAEVVKGSAASPGQPILLELDGMGIRDIAAGNGSYIIIGGSFHGGGKARLFRWKGGRSEPKQFQQVHLKNLNPESIALSPDGSIDAFQLFTDDSGKNPGGKRCIDLFHDTARFFRGVWVGQGSQER